MCCRVLVFDFAFFDLRLLQQLVILITLLLRLRRPLQRNIPLSFDLCAYRLRPNRGRQAVLRFHPGAGLQPLILIEIGEVDFQLLLLHFFICFYVGFRLL